MNIILISIIVAISTLGIEACHHRGETFPPDNFPQDARKKRGVNQELYTFYPTNPAPTGPVDADKELSDFFTTCMFEKTGSVFPSWRSVIEFVFRDTRWYSSTEEQYCPEKSDTDPTSTSCWQNRLSSLLQTSSRLLPKAKQCVQEYVWSKEIVPSRIRGKRQISTSIASSKLENCLGVSRDKYNKCLKDGLLTSSNLREYPSLKNWNGPSVDAFVTEHLSGCRITSRYTGGRNVYRETCPSAAPFLPNFNVFRQCLSTTYNEVVRTSSPLWRVQGDCSEKFSGGDSDKCKNVRCFGNKVCDPNTGNCVCKSGYVSNFLGSCVVQDKCSVVFCGGRHETCDSNTGRCVCIAGYVRNSATGLCEPQNKCIAVFCGGRFETCDPNTGNCVCITGYVRNPVTRACERRNPCTEFRCPNNMECQVNNFGYPSCVCRSGFVPNPQGTGCIRLDPCATIQCAQNMRCINGACVCRSGFVPAPNSRPGCVRPDPCATILCAQNMRCVNGACVCRNGFVPAPNNRPGCVRPDPCATVRCEQNMICADGTCVCMSGFIPAPIGCVRPDPCANVNCDRNMRCFQGSCVCRPGFVPAPNNQRGCVRPDPCAAVQCQANSDCVNGRCICRENFELVGNVCRRINPCANVQCARNMVCRGGTCVCRNGFVPSQSGPGCVPQDPCGSVNCDSNSTCVNGQCRCRPGFFEDDGRCISICDVFCSENEDCILEGPIPRCQCKSGLSLNQFGECVVDNPCANIRCARNMRCENGQCVCRSGFVPAQNGQGCVRPPPDPCAGISCPPNSNCVLGDCVCDDGFQKRGELCLQPNACDGITCGRNQRCVNGICECLPGFVLVPEGVDCIRERGVWRQWQQWQECSASCGSGDQIRFRDCDGNNCDGDPVQTRPCNTNPCISDWREWQQWQACSVSCGGGTQIRIRQCGGNNCVGDPVQSRDCNTQNCADSLCRNVRCPGELTCTRGQCGCPPGSNRTPVDTCITCPAGKSYRECAPACYQRCGGRAGPDDIAGCLQNCRQGVYCVCPAGQIERSSTDSTCITPDQCPGSWGSWGQWVSCTASCGGGVRLRSRSCEGSDCDGSQTETEQCNTNPCPTLGNCQSPKISNSCPTRCPATCLTLGIVITCESGCRENVGCVCPEGMVERSLTDSTCVMPSQCQGSGPCFPNPCQNGGSCVATTSSRYLCNCQPGYSGRHCEIGCGAQCSPNGRCVRGSCQCNPGFRPNGQGGCTRG